MVQAAPAEEAGSHLLLRSLTKAYGTARPAVNRLDLAIRRGELIGLLGPSGCGKTTTLRMIAGLIEPTDGVILGAGRDLTRVPPHHRNMGLVFQSYALFPHMTVADNVAFGLKLRGLPRKEISRRTSEALELVKLDGYGARRPRALSGGQQQRVALARALVIEPDFLLLDEPLSNLDAKLRDEMRNEIRDIQQRLGITTVFVTHDQAEALGLCDRIAILHDGALEQFGPPTEIYERPASPFVATFVGRTNEFACLAETRGTARRLIFAGQPIPTPRHLPDKPNVTAMVRPHHITIRSGSFPGALTGRIIRRTFVGDIIEVVVLSGETQVLVELRSGVDDDRDLSVGCTVSLDWVPERTIVF